MAAAEPARRSSAPRRLAALPLLALLALAGCAALTPAPSAAPTVITPPRLVFDRFDELEGTTFSGVPLGRARLSAMEEPLALHRYNRQPAAWGAADGGQSFRVVILAHARSQGVTALVLEGEGEDPVVASILVRNLGGAPPPAVRFEELLPWLAARFRAPFEVYDVPESQANAHLREPRQYRYVFPKGGGAKLGFLRGADGAWYLENVEYFSSDWSPQALARVKRLPPLHKVGVLKAGGRWKDPRAPAPAAEPAQPSAVR